MRAKVTSISTAQQKDKSEASWLAFANALSGVWGWTQTKLVWTENGEHREQPVTWRVSPCGAVAFFRAPMQSGLSLSLPYTKQSAGSGNPRGGTLYHKGGYVQAIGGSSSEIAATDGSAPIDYGALVKVEIFFDYIVEG